MLRRPLFEGRLCEEVCTAHGSTAVLASKELFLEDPSKPKFLGFIIRNCTIVPGTCLNRYLSATGVLVDSSNGDVWRRAGSGGDLQLCIVGAACSSGSSI